MEHKYQVFTITYQVRRIFLTIFLHYLHRPYCFIFQYSILFSKLVINVIARSILPYHTLIYLSQVTVMFIFTTQCRHDTHLFQEPNSLKLYSCSMKFVLKYKYFLILEFSYFWIRIILGIKLFFSKKDFKPINI